MNHNSITWAHGVAPARNSAHGASGRTAGGQSHGLHILVEGGGVAQLDQHDVIVNVVGAVIGMTDDFGGPDELLGSLVGTDVVLSQTHLNAAETIQSVNIETHKNIHEKLI